MSFDALEQVLAGELYRPGDDRWEEGRTLFNSMVERRPGAIARVAGDEDVSACIEWARTTGTELSVRAGGHSVAGASLNDGGLVIDTRGLDTIEVDPVARTARVGAGLTWAPFDAATQEHGLATTGGRVSTTGVAGLTLGGGSGWLERSFGLACDNLIGARLVTASGAVVHVGEHENAELLWALRGGGGNFGVVTELEFRLHSVGPTVFGGIALYDPADAVTVIRAFRDFFDDGEADEAGLAVVYLTAPAEEFIPAEWHGRPMIALAGCWSGTVEDGERAVRPLLGCAEAVVDLFDGMPYVELQSFIDDPPGYRNWWTAEYLDELTDDAIDTFVHYSNEMPTSFTQSLLVPWGGEVARRLDSPLAKRDAAYVLHPFCVWEGADRDAEHLAWGRACRTVFARWTSGGVYLNFVGNEGEERVRAAYGDAYERLATLKAELDPENLFRGNQNIRPRTQLVS